MVRGKRGNLARMPMGFLMTTESQDLGLTFSSEGKCFFTV